MRTATPGMAVDAYPLAPVEEVHPDARVLAELPGIDGGLWQLCLHPFSYRRSENPDITSLTETAGSLDPTSLENVFYDPVFLAASRMRVERQQMSQLILWEEDAGARVPRFCLPVFEEGSSLLQPAHLRNVEHAFAPVGTPLVSSGDEDDRVAEKLCELLELAFTNGAPALIMRMVANSPFMERVWHRSRARAGKLAIERFATGSRAGIAHANRERAQPGKSSRRELRRLEKKLAELGEVTFTTAHTPFDVLLHFEEHLLLEAQSWKGRRGTAIQTAKRHAAFARQAVSDLARLQSCTIYMLRLNGSLIASLIVFEKNGCFFPWKISYDEAYRRFSPGTLLMVRTTEALTGRDDFRLADSLARLDGSWMDRLWPDQFEYLNYAIAPTQAEAKELLSIGQFKNRIKSAIKHLIRKGG